MNNAPNRPAQDVEAAHIPVLKEAKALRETEPEKARRLAEEALSQVELAGALAEAETQKQRAEDANKLKSELLAIAAHDLKNPLQSIMGFAQLISLKAMLKKSAATPQL